MTGSGRLSLRARLLVLLIAVTAVFLLIMGAVSTLVLSKRLGGQFNAELVAAAQRTPRQIARQPGRLRGGRGHQAPAGRSGR